MRGLKGLIVAGMAAAAAVTGGCGVEAMKEGDIGSFVCFKGDNGKIQVLTREGLVTTPEKTADLGDGTCLVGDEVLVLKPDHASAEYYFKTPPIAPVHIYPHTPSNG